jgi:predicted TIM-barrel fold metal-dependent hydrolase
MNFIDFHAHLFPTEASLQALLRIQKENAITQTVVVAGGVATRHELSSQMLLLREKNFPVPNAEILSLTKQSQHRLLPFYFANPHKSPEEYQVQGSHYYGLKLGPVIHGVPLEDERIAAYLNLASTFQHPVYLHCLAVPGFEVSALIKLTQLYPKLNFVLGHAGIGHCDFMGVDLIKPYPRIYLETSGGFSSLIRYANENLGIDRLLFGSEFPLQDAFVEKTKLLRLGISLERLTQNAQRLLNRGQND